GLAALIDRYQPQSFSEHLAWSSHGPVFLNVLLPLAYDESTLDRVCKLVDQVQSSLIRTLLLENPATYLAFEASTLDEPHFISEVIR
ncbi:multinuclear nonheme iron-dependent oxidase, partial [Pseudomonas brassicacearum]|uniref:multinuclear nonheme iron-dependent oxidase n=1 Tax=Pseudomonas brassicacearum TaxID=930166 RepID=UPI000F49E3FC